MLQYNLNEISYAVFQELCDERTSESETLDFKQILPGKEDEDREELAKDVASFLNASGGDLVYGIAEDRASGTAKAVLPILEINFDKESRRILQTLDAWIEPRAHGIQIIQVQLLNGIGIVIRVPSSFNGPHCVRSPSSTQRRFVVRNGNMTSNMSYDQIKNAFDRTSTLAEKARQIIEERLKLVSSGRTARPLEKGPICVAEFVPFSGISGRGKADVARLHRHGSTDLALPLWRSVATRSLNLDGLIIHPAGGGDVSGLTRAFRDGSLETIQICGGEGHLGKKQIWSQIASEFFQQAAKASYAFAIDSEISGPALMRFALMHIDDHQFEFKNNWWSNAAKADRSNLIFPEVYIEDVSVNVDFEELVAPTVEILWQAFGLQMQST